MTELDGIIRMIVMAVVALAVIMGGVFALQKMFPDSNRAPHDGLPRGINAFEYDGHVCVSKSSALQCWEKR